MTSDSPETLLKTIIVIFKIEVISSVLKYLLFISYEIPLLWETE